MYFETESLTKRDEGQVSALFGITYYHYLNRSPRITQFNSFTPCIWQAPSLNIKSESRSKFLSVTLLLLQGPPVACKSPCSAECRIKLLHSTRKSLFQTKSFRSSRMENRWTKSMNRITRRSNTRSCSGRLWAAFSVVSAYLTFNYLLLGLVSSAFNVGGLWGSTSWQNWYLHASPVQLSTGQSSRRAAIFMVSFSLLPSIS